LSRKEKNMSRGLGRWQRLLAQSAQESGQEGVLLLRVLSAALGRPPSRSEYVAAYEAARRLVQRGADISITRTGGVHRSGRHGLFVVIGPRSRAKREAALHASFMKIVKRLRLS
jgi:hypothetical protein